MVKNVKITYSVVFIRDYHSPKAFYEANVSSDVFLTQLYHSTLMH